MQKNNQFGDKNVTIHLMENPSSRLCPVRAFKNMCSLNPCGPESPAFCVIRNGLPVPIDALCLDRNFKKLMKRTNLAESESYSMHSFRRGGASFYFRAGVSGEVIQLLGNWASDCYIRYLRFSDASLLHAASVVSKNLKGV